MSNKKKSTNPPSKQSSVGNKVAPKIEKPIQNVLNNQSTNSRNGVSSEKTTQLKTAISGLLSKYPISKVQKLKRGLEQEFVVVFHEEKLISEDWENTKTIVHEEIYQLINTYLFANIVNNTYQDRDSFVFTEMKKSTASVNEIVEFLVSDYLSKIGGNTPSAIPSVLDTHVPISVPQPENNVIQPKKIIVETPSTTSDEFIQVHNHAPITERLGNEAIVAAHNNTDLKAKEEEMIRKQRPNPSVQQEQAPTGINFQESTNNQITQNTPQMSNNPNPTQSKVLLTPGQQLINLNYNDNPEALEMIQQVKLKLSEVADIIIRIESKAKNELEKDMVSFAKHNLIDASTSCVRVVSSLVK